MRSSLYAGFLVLAAAAPGCGPAVTADLAEEAGVGTSGSSDASGDSTGEPTLPATTTTPTTTPTTTTLGSTGEGTGESQDDGSDDSSSSDGPIQTCPEDQFPRDGSEVIELVTQSSVDTWDVVGDNSAYFSFLTDESAIDGEQARGLSATDDADAFGFGATVSTLSAEPFRGQRVRMWSWVARENVESRSNLWLRVDGPGGAAGTLAIDNGTDQPGYGTSADWTREEIVLDVPETASTLVFGSLLTGQGLFIVNDPTFEIVSEDVPTTLPNLRRPEGADSCLAPTDRYTEEILHVLRPDAWAPYDPATAPPSPDTQNLYDGVRTLRIDAAPGGTWGGFASSTAQLAGQRVRVTIPMRSEGFSGTARLTISTPSGGVAYGHVATVNPTEAWSKFSVVTEVPASPTEGSGIGLQLEGTGTIWVGYGQMERVGPEVTLSEPIPE